MKDQRQQNEREVRMHPLPVLSLIGWAVALAGCASPEEIAAADCRSLGFTPGTEAYVSCVMGGTRGARAPIPLNGVTPQASMPPVPQAGSAGQALLPQSWPEWLLP